LAKRKNLTTRILSRKHTRRNNNLLDAIISDPELPEKCIRTAGIVSRVLKSQGHDKESNFVNSILDAFKSPDETHKAKLQQNVAALRIELNQTVLEWSQLSRDVNPEKYSDLEQKIEKLQTAINDTSGVTDDC